MRWPPPTPSPEPADGRLDIGGSVGPYRLVERIGRGGMGEVFKAERSDGAFDRHVAIKVMRSTGLDTDLLRRFRIERQILASLRHPNIVTLLDGGAAQVGPAYLVMELVNGTEIMRHCRDARLSLTARLELFRTLCAAVQYAHQHGVVHRDLKPANILIEPDGTLKVLDFGVAKLLQRTPESGETTHGVLPGPLTPNYASPEQLRGLPVTTASDVLLARDHSLRAGCRQAAVRDEESGVRSGARARGARPSRNRQAPRRRTVTFAAISTRS